MCQLQKIPNKTQLYKHVMVSKLQVYWKKKKGNNL